MNYLALCVAVSVAFLGSGCEQPAPTQSVASESFYGTLEPFAKESIYFVMTDRFVNGDEQNDYRDQGGEKKTFDRPVPGAPSGESDNIGYLGGDFRGVLNNAAYIRDMGFSAVWVTPIVDNPDAVFLGGKPVNWGSFWTDQGKTGYHGYWGVNFYKEDEHLVSEGLRFADFTQAMHAQKLKVVLDIVGNHGSPSYTMPQAQPEFGKLYDKDGKLLADHQNLSPAELQPQNNPLHAFFNTKPGIAELSDFNENNPAVLDYLSGAYLQWAAQGADAFRIDTIGWMPHPFWKMFSERVRAQHPNFFMFGEDFRWDANDIAPHTHPENGQISVLDFPMKAAMAKVFENGEGFDVLANALYLQHKPYRNVYDLVTFYDNHDMPRMNASDEGFIDAHNWLFTTRGIPAVYYGSETGFMRGRAEHAGNRNYFGQNNIANAVQHPIYKNLQRIAKVRSQSVALQQGLQLNLNMQSDYASFYRVFQHEGTAQIALVLLNKSGASHSFSITQYVQTGVWRSAMNNTTYAVADEDALSVDVPAHGVEVLLLSAPVSHDGLRAALKAQMQ